MPLNRYKCTLKSILLGSLVLFGLVEFLLITLNDVKLYYEESNDHYYVVSSTLLSDNEEISLNNNDAKNGEDHTIRGGAERPFSAEDLNQEPKSLEKSTSIGSGDKRREAIHENEKDDTLPSIFVLADDYNEATYNMQLKKTLEPIPNERTAAYLHVFWSGFCNQYYMFSGVLLLAKSFNYTQIVVQSIRWKDLFGTNQQIRHDFFFDVVHWNIFYPTLPRFVSYNASLPEYSEIQISNPDGVKPNIKWNIDNPHKNATKPFAIGEKRTEAIMKFYDYTKDIFKGRTKRDESELLMMKSALRPHPAIVDIMKKFKRDNHMTNMMVLHARIEPDMQKHPMCKEHKVLNITDIVTMLYEKYPEPPVSTVLVILNRKILEEEVDNPKRENEMAVHNLNALNEMIRNGLWSGQVKVVEAGSGLAKDSKYPLYSKYSSLVGSIINFFLSLEAEIFVGTIVSSYSTAVISYRFFREKKENYFYLPKGLDWVTAPDVVEPPRFAC